MCLLHIAIEGVCVIVYVIGVCVYVCVCVHVCVCDSTTTA